MEIIDVNKKSSFQIYYDEERKGWYKYNKDWSKQSYRQRQLGDAAVPRDNIIFAAYIVPAGHSTTRGGGSVMMRDAEDGTIYRMTQRSLHGLLNAILLNTIDIEHGAYSGLFTFRAISDDLAVDVYTGHYSDALLAEFRDGINQG